MTTAMSKRPVHCDARTGICLLLLEARTKPRGERQGEKVNTDGLRGSYVADSSAAVIVTRLVLWRQSTYNDSTVTSFLVGLVVLMDVARC